MFESLAGALEAGLSLWSSKESRKYLDEVIRLRKEYYEEDNKERPDMARLDRIEFQLCNLCEAFSAKVRKSNIANPS